MIRLLYVSTARQPVTSELLADILRVSRHNNAKVGVTGLLIVGGKRFLQALEGPALAVLATYKRIGADPRHFAVVELDRERIEARQFAGWAMGVQAGRRADDDASVAEAVRALIAPIADPTLRGYFNGFAERQAAA